MDSIALTPYAHARAAGRRGCLGAVDGAEWRQNGNMDTPKMGIIVGPNVLQAVDSEDIGEVAERLNAPVLKTGVPLRGP